MKRSAISSCAEQYTMTKCRGRSPEEVPNVEKRGKPRSKWGWSGWSGQSGWCGVEWGGSLMIVEAFIIHVCACVHAWTECVAGSECVSQCVSQCVSEKVGQRVGRSVSEGVELEGQHGRG
jgi:hypothetical protein